MFYIITFKEKTEKVRYVLVQNINQQNVGKKKKLDVNFCISFLGPPWQSHSDSVA